MKTTQKNEQLKRRFYEWLKASKGFSDDTVHSYEKAIWLWEDFTSKDDFGKFNKTIAGAFKEWLKNKKKVGAETNISLSYCYDTLRFLKVFFDWLSKQAGYKSRIDQTAVDYLNLTRKEVKEATQPKTVKYPVLDEIKRVIENIKGKTEIEMRDKALFSLALLTGARISAIRTLPMNSFDRNNLVIYQDPALGVETKFSKKIISSLMPFSYQEALGYFLEWFDYLEKKGFKASDPIFPATKVENGKENINYYNTEKVENKKLKSSSSLRAIFKKRFEQAGIKYYHPHTFRHWWVKEISKLPLTEEEKKAISQNLGHENVGTTFGSYGYGKLDENRQIDIIKNIDFEGRKREIKYSLSKEDIKQLVAEAMKKEDPRA
ncbi:MAG: site-specific integrase [Candidatus Staskawiczbacteria bacterium]|nr:site-specific integrase [Candidatus Staskawiczbacteria bacterium]